MNIAAIAIGHDCLSYSVMYCVMYCTILCSMVLKIFLFSTFQLRTEACTASVSCLGKMWMSVSEQGLEFQSCESVP